MLIIKVSPMNVNDNNPKFAELLLAALKVRLIEQSVTELHQNSLESLCRLVSPEQMLRLGKTRIILQQAVRPIACFHSPNSSRKIRPPTFEPVAISREGLAIYVLSKDDADELVSSRKMLPNLVIDVSETLEL